VADKAGNIWRLEEGGRLLVFVGDRWLLAHESLVEAGSPAGMISYITTLGDGQKIYGCDRNGAPDKFGAFFGEVKDGKLSFTVAPRILVRDENSLKVRDADEAIWGFAPIKEANGRVQQQLICLGTDGIREKLEPFGNPKLVDAAGNLWVEKNVGNAGSTFKIWRKGEWVQELNIPDLTKNYPFFSDRPGSVFAWTSQGLQQLVADAPDFKQYRLGKLYSIDNLSGEVTTLAYSKQGYLVLVMQGGSSNSPWTLGLLKLPEEKKDP
jgi:hypothetical protein